MNNNILDEIEKYEGPRTCPECGHQFPFMEFVRQYVRSKGGLTKWPCQGCGELITCDYIKIRFFWLLGLLPFGFLLSVLLFYFDLGVFNFIFLLPFFVFMLLTFYYAKFNRYE